MLVTKPVSLEADGAWCPMSHANRNTDSFQHLPPLRRVRTTQQITDPAVWHSAWNNLGSYTGETVAVCSYMSPPSHPALVAFDYQDGSVRWTSPLENLPSLRPRLVPGEILLAKMRVNGKPMRRYVFASTWAELAAYDADSGKRVWKRSAHEIAEAVGGEIGAPRTLRFNDAKELVTVTTRGWVIKLNPLDGSTADAYKMETNVIVKGRIYQGGFISIKSPVVIGNVLYLVVRFEADPSLALDPMLCPVHVVRIELSRRRGRGQEPTIKPLTQPAASRDSTPDRVVIGVNKTGASAPAMVTSDGKVLIFAQTYTVMNGQLQPTIVAVEDDHGVLKKRWQSVLDVTLGDDVRSAPALHKNSRTLLVTTGDSIYVFRDVDALTGSVPSPSPLFGEALVTCRTRRAARIRVGSPFALTFDQDANEIVAYTNFREVPVFRGRAYSFLGAFALTARGRDVPRPLWCHPLAVTAAGEPAPGPGTFGQPALFRYESGNGQATGLIVNTAFTGTYIFK